MKRFFLTWWKLLSVLSLGAVILGTAIWHTTRPVALDPEALTLSQLPPSCPGAQLRLELSPHRISTATFFNGSDLTFYHGDPPDYCGVDVQLNGQWYDVPCRAISSSAMRKPGGVTTSKIKFVWVEPGTIRKS